MFLDVFGCFLDGNDIFCKMSCANIFFGAYFLKGKVIQYRKHIETPYIILYLCICTNSPITEYLLREVDPASLNVNA